MAGQAPTRDSLAQIIESRRQLTKDEITALATTLGSSAENGLSATDNISARKAKFGENKFKEVAAKALLRFFLDTLGDSTLIILMISAAVSIVLSFTFGDGHELIDGLAILAAVFIVSGVTAANDWSKDRKFRQLSAIAKDRKIKVIRNGEQTRVSVYDLLVGDVLFLTTGDVIPADALLIDGHDASVDEAPMTGEPEPIAKAHGKDVVFLSGCMVVEGQCNVLVVAVGSSSQWGAIQSSLQKEPENTPLQDKLENLAENIGKLGIFAAALTLVALLGTWGYSTYYVKALSFEPQHLSVIVEAVITSVTIVVVAVPEGLPLAVTLALAYSMMKMMKDQNLVRYLAACETMGGATSICSDKTGTLTANRMTVVEYWVAPGSTFTELPEQLVRGTNKAKYLDLVAETIAVNSTAVIRRRQQMINGQPKDLVDYIGAPTECALLQTLEQSGYDYENIRRKISPNVVTRSPFSSSKKRASVLYKTTQNGEEKLLVACKGASEIILGLSTSVMTADGTVVPLSAELRAQAAETIDGWAKGALRTLCIAARWLPADTDTNGGSGEFDRDLTLLAIVGIEDPLRHEVPPAVEACKSAGVTVRMLTGDNIITATSIAKKCKIIDSENQVAIEGPEFRAMTTAQIDELIPRLRVIARCSPEDKLRLVARLKALGEVVAATGDGTNDAPQLKEANVGFSMGIAGTEVAKEASDIILLDDNFASIVKALMWGRNVFDSIRKFVQFQVTVNIVAVITSFVGAVTGGESPLKAVQLLWVNLIMDTMAALALATEAPTPDLLKRPPYGRNAPLITKRMWRNILGQAIYQLAVLAVLVLYGADKIPFLDVDPTDHLTKTTLIFNTFVFCQIFNEINSRMLGDEANPFKRIFSNAIFIGVLIFTVTAQYLIVTFGGHFTATTPLSEHQWIFSIAVGAFCIPYGTLIRAISVGDEKVEKPHVDDIPPEDEAFIIRQRLARKSALDITKKSDSAAQINAQVAAVEPPHEGGLKGSLRWRAVGHKVVAQASVIKAFRGRQESSSITDFN